MHEKEAKTKINYLPASNDWSISSKGLVLFSAITLVCTASVCCVLLIFPLWWGFLSFLPPLFLFPHFLPLQISPSEGDTVHTGTDLQFIAFMGVEKLHCHISCFSPRKLAAGVAYLPWTEILAARGWGVAAITSFTIISFRLIHLKSCHLIFWQ